MTVSKSSKQPAKKSKKVLKKWNGRAQHPYKGTFYIAAYSANQAAKLIAQAVKSNRSFANEIKVYYSPTWGTTMDGIEPMEPCLYNKPDFGPNIKKLI